MASNLESSGSQPVPRVRIATPADKDAYVTALITGYETDRQYTWRYPRRKEFPQDRRAASEQIFENLIADDKMVIYVAELPRIEDEGSENPDWIVVGEAVWEQKYWHQVDSEMALTSFPPADGKRRDMDPIRQDTFIKFIAMLEKKYCGLEWGDERLELANIVVHGQYHRRGVGKALMETGLKLARERNVAITLTAGPNGRSLYTSVGFKELGYDECSVPNEDEKIGVWTMIWTPEGWKKEGS